MAIIERSFGDISILMATPTLICMSSGRDSLSIDSKKLTDFIGEMIELKQEAIKLERDPYKQMMMNK